MTPFRLLAAVTAALVLAACDVPNDPDPALEPHNVPSDGGTDMRGEERSRADRI